MLVGGQIEDEDGEKTGATVQVRGVVRQVVAFVSKRLVERQVAYFSWTAVPSEDVLGLQDEMEVCQILFSSEEHGGPCGESERGKQGRSLL